MACPKADPRPDAGATISDSGPADAGVADVAVGPCADWCQGSCYGERCIERQTSCRLDADCEQGQRCSTEGECFADACLSHGDCPADQRCAGGRCLPRLAPAAGVIFERVNVPILHDHHSPLFDPEINWPPAGASADMGFGVALFDYDGDLDLDLFLGSQGQDIGGTPACIYRNESVAANLRFVADDEFCRRRNGDLAAGFGTDLDGDGFHELITTGLFHATLHRFHPERESIDLLALLDEENERRRCFPSSAISFDLNHDGRLDLILGCALGPMDENVGERDVSYRNIAYLQTANGDLEVLSPEAWNRDQPILMEAQGVTLALGAVDMDNDGLLDLLVSEDRRVMDPSIEWLDPGGLYRRCAPNESCRFAVRRFGNEGDEFGAYMGTGLIQIDQRGEYVYVTNETANRLVRFDDETITDIAHQMGVQLDYMGRHKFFSWGVVIDDFDRDGQDDFFISNGNVMGVDSAAFSAHFDAVFLQRDGRFNLHSGDLGISPFTNEDSRNDQRSYSSRAALKADLDGDGFIDLVGVALEGRPRLHREVPNQRPDPLRCTLVPIDRYVPGYGIGHALIPADGPARRWDSQGQTRSGASPFVLSPWPTGKLRFPSGAEVPFDCQNEAGPVLVEEPSWLGLSRRGETLRIELHLGAPSGALTLFTEPSAQTLEGVATDGGLHFDLPAGDEHFFVRFDGRWMGRRFAWNEILP